MTQIFYCYLFGPVGDFLVAGTDTSLHYTGFTSGHQQREPSAEWRRDTAPLSYAIPQFEAYFNGEPIDFDIPLSVQGTPFQQDVWRELQKVGFGQTASYGNIATRLGNPGASRAVGAANRANHLPIIIPCHRIIGADQSLTGFGGGLEAKLTLLRLEGAKIPTAQPDLFT